MTPDEEFRFLLQVGQDAQRTVLCEPHRLDGVLAAVARAGLSDTLTVKASRACPEGQLIVLDEQAMEAGFRQTAQRSLKGFRFFR